MRTSLLLACLLALAVPCAAQQPSLASLLLWVEYLPDSPSDCERLRTEFLVYRDGVVIERDQGGSFLYIYRLHASGQAMAALSLAMLENQIGFVSGECNTGEFVPNGGFLIRIDWFGKAPRRSSFTTGDLSKPFPPCSGRQLALEHAVRGYIARAQEDPAATTAAVPHPAQPPCPE